MAGTPSESPPKRRDGYHHGNLRAVMVEAAVKLIEERGAEGVTVREVARRAGVSSGAPFRHFASRKALMTAVAVAGMEKLRAEIEAGLSDVRSTCPLARLVAIGDAYIKWAVEHPTHYQVLGDRTLVDFYQTEALLRDNRWIREQMLALIAEADTRSLLRTSDINLVSLQSRAMAYGLARMYVDSHLEEFGISADQAREAMSNALREFLIGLARDPETMRLSV